MGSVLEYVGTLQQRIVCRECHPTADHAFLVNDQIEALYAGGAQQLPLNALKFLDKPKEMVLHYPLACKQLWLEAVQAAQLCRQLHEFWQYLGKQSFMAL